MMQGYGVMIYKSQSCYEGNWEKGKRSGKGKYTNMKGNTYIIGFVDD